MTQGRIDPEIIRREINTLRAAYPDIAEDEEQWLLTLESETGLIEFLTDVLRRILLTEAHVDANKIELTDLKKRQQRFADRVEGLRRLAKNVMLEAGQRKVELPRATLSVNNGVPRVIITRESDLPDNVVEIVRKPSLTQIKKLIDNGETVPGAELSNAEPYLRITK